MDLTPITPDGIPFSRNSRPIASPDSALTSSIGFPPNCAASVDNLSVSSMGLPPN